MPLAAAPRFDHLRGDDVNEDLGEAAPFGIPLEVVRRFVPAEIWIQHHRQEQIVAVVDDDDLAARAFGRRVVDQILLGTVRADVALERELPGDDLLDRDLLFPAVAAVTLLAARFGHILGAAEGTLGLGDSRFARHSVNYTG